ncbi:MAG: response regulator transcription factor [Streptosporangiaceae bacterium]
MSTGTPAGDQLIKVAAVDDHPIVLDGIANWITGADVADVTGPVWVVSTAASVDALLAGPGRDAHVVLLDLDLQDGTTVEDNVAAILAARRDWISPRLAYIFATDDAPDRPALSPQEARALRLYATGMPMKSVARRMMIGEETVKQYVGRVREKYSRAGRAAPTKMELYYRAVEDGYLPPPPPPEPRNPPSR